MNSSIESLIEQIEAQPQSDAVLKQVQSRISQLTMPPRAMGRVLDLAEELTVAAGRLPSCKKSHVFLFAGEHGVVCEGVSAFPAEVTRQMLMNFINGGAAINQLCASTGAKLTVVNVATGGEYPKHPDLVDHPVAKSSNNLLKQFALEEEAMVKAILLGAQLACDSIEQGSDVLSCGEMGIGNTTASSCLCAAITHCDVSDAVGRGTGVDDKGLKRKKEVVSGALQRTQPTTALDILKEFGGYELAAIVGVILQAAVSRVPFILDGFNVTAAAAVAKLLVPRCTEVMIASHQGAEPGHKILLDYLGKEPYLDWGLRLGEGSGAVLMLPLCQASTAMVSGMATFEEAAVSSK